MHPAYRLLEHTSDIRVEIRGTDLPELFANGMFCIFDVMLENPPATGSESRIVRLKSPDLPELFLDWLRELLFLFSTRSYVPAQALVACRLSPVALRAELRGETYDPVRHGLKLEIKTPTYHQYRLSRTSAGYLATVVFDV